MSFELSTQLAYGVAVALVITLGLGHHGFSLIDWLAELGGENDNR